MKEFNLLRINKPWHSYLSGRFANKHPLVYCTKDSFFTDSHIDKNGKNIWRIVTVNCFEKTNFVFHSLLSGACPNLPNSTRDSACNDGSLRLSCCSPRKFFIIILTFYMSLNMIIMTIFFLFCYRLGICQKIYTTQFSGEKILHTENA